MADIPRRLPPSDAERLRVVVTRTAGGGNLGSTRWAQPVTKTSMYSPVNADDAPDVGIYTAATFQSTEIVTNVGDPADDEHYVIATATLAADVLKPNAVYLVEARAPIAFNYASYYPPGFQDPDGVQVWVDGVTSFTVVDTSTPGPSRGFYPDDDRPVFVPPYDDGLIVEQTNFPRMTLTVTAIAEFPAGATPALTLNLKSVGPSVKSILGTHYLRATYVGVPTSAT